MKKILGGVLFVLFAGNSHAQNPNLTAQSVYSSNAPGNIIYFYQYTPPHYNNIDLFPLIISLHGVGQAGDYPYELPSVLGDGLPYLVNQGAQLEFTWSGKTEGFVMLAPQTNRTLVNDWPAYYIDEMIAYGINNLRVDPSRIFLVGFSAGGGGVWSYATSSAGAAAKLAGIAPSSSSDLGTNFCNIASQKVAVWAFHGGSDPLIPELTDHYKTAAVNNCSPAPLIPAVDTVISNEGHGIYQSVTYDVTNNHHYPNVFQWMLKVNRNLNPATNLPPVPVISAGATLNLTTPVKVKDFPLLDATGSYDPDDIIMDYWWDNPASPPGSNISLINQQWPVATVSAGNGVVGMPIGNYTFRLRVKDYLTSAIYGANNHTQFANLNVNINYPPSGFSAPATDAGGSITIPSEQNEVTHIIGQAQAYPCGGCNVTNYNWVQLSGPSATLSNYNNTSQPYSSGDNAISFTSLNSAGVYKFQFSATTSHGDVGSDIFTVTKLSALPVTYAYFNGQGLTGKNVLNWATNTEVNSLRFDIQRSTDGIYFTTIGAIASKGGTALTPYAFEDKAAPAGPAYYRLSQVDKDGRSSLSSSVLVNNKKPGLFIETYPNPAHDNLVVSVQGNATGMVKVMITDMQGKTLLLQQWQKASPQCRKEMNIASLQKGIYQMMIMLGQDKQVSSFVKY